MNDPREERELERFLAGQSPVSREYDRLPAEEPPAELDAQILAAAEAEVRQDQDGVVVPFTRPWQRWATAVGVAASFMLAFVVVMQVAIRPFMGSDEQDAPASVRFMEEMEGPAQVRRESPRSSVSGKSAQDRLMPGVGDVAPRPERTPREFSLQQDVPANEPVAGLADMDTRVPVQAEPPAAPTLEALGGADAKAAGEPRLVAAVAIVRAYRQPVASATMDDVIVTTRKRETAAERRAAEKMERADARLDNVLRLYDEGKVEKTGRELEAFLDDYPEHPVSEEINALD